MSCSVSRLSRDRDLRGSPGPGEGHTESRQSSCPNPQALQQGGPTAQPNPSSSRASMRAASPCPAQTLSLSPSLTCARLFPRAAVAGPGSDAVQQWAAEEPFMQLCLQRPDAQPDAHQPPLAADLQREGQCQGQLCQAGKVLHGDTGKESMESHPAPCQRSAGHSTGSSEPCSSAQPRERAGPGPQGVPRSQCPGSKWNSSLSPHSPAHCSGALCCSSWRGSPRSSG